MRVVLWREFDGTNYAGFQRQANAMTVQQLVEENIYKVTGARPTLTGASRTDAGVHAAAFAAHFDTEASLPPEKYAYALNAGLPGDIRVFSSCEAPPGFHARFSAKRKHYRYVVNNAAHASALHGRTQYHYHGRLDGEAMRRAAEYVAGERDFACFMAAGSKVKSTVRTVFESEISVQGSLIIYDVAGDGFLYNMVRIIAGTLIEIGSGKYAPERMKEIIESRSRRIAGPTAPASGLMLMGIEY